MSANTSLLVLGESDSGKTHFGAQVLKRLSLSESHLKMDGAATNLGPFEATLNALSEGRPSEHTPASVYVESAWPVKTDQGSAATLVWPDYGGEQLKNIIADRRFPSAWRERVIAADGWLLMIRLRQVRLDDDIFSKPLSTLPAKIAEPRTIKPSDQSRLIELLQMLMHLRVGAQASLPRLCILLSCWDEISASKPRYLVHERLPMLMGFVDAHWPEHKLFGLSALGRALPMGNADEEYIDKGPEAFGYVVSADGERSSDLTLPLSEMINVE